MEYCSLFVQIYDGAVNKGVTASNGMKVGKDQLADRMLNPAGFKRFFDDMKKAEKAGNPMAWEGV